MPILEFKMRQENQKELEFLENMTRIIANLQSQIGDLNELPTPDKSSIVNAINNITLGQYKDPKIDEVAIIQKFTDRLNTP